MKKIQRNILGCLFLIFLSACSGPGQMLTNNLSVPMHAESYRSVAAVGCFAPTPDSIDVYIALDAGLLPETTNAEGQTFKSLSVRVQVFETFASRYSADTATLFTGPLPSGQAGILMLNRRMRAPAGKSYQLAYRPAGSAWPHWGLLSIDRRSPQNGVHFFLTDDGHQPVMPKVVNAGQALYIRPAAPSDDQYIYVRQAASPALPLPVFATTLPAAGRPVFRFYGRLRIEDESKTPFLLKEPGIYALQLDTLRSGAMMVQVTSSADEMEMLKQALRYICTVEEWRWLEEGDRSAWDFWESIGGSTQRAIQLARRYGERVRLATRHFSGVVPGWATDRGMLYIVMGPPDEIFRNDAYETWNYRQQGTTRPVSFNFRRIPAWPEGWDYVAERNPTYRQIWYDAVERCRQ